MTDIIMQAEAAGCIIKNHLYALWEIQKWFREEKELDIEIEAWVDKDKKVTYLPWVVFTWCLEEQGDWVYYDTYEEALIAGLKEAFTVLKEFPKPCAD